MFLSGGLKLAYLVFENTDSTDAKLYYYYGKELATHNSLPKEASFLHNIGFPLTLGILFKIFDYDYDGSILLQQYYTIILSSILIPIVYLFLRNFFEPKYSLIGASLIAFDPRIIQNSTFGITEPLYLVLFVASLVFVLKEKRLFHYLSFFVAGLACVVRFEGIVLIPILFLFLYKKKIVKHIMPLTLIFFLPVFVTGLFYLSEVESDHVTHEINREVSVLTRVMDNESSIVFKLFNSIVYLGWFTFPMLLFFIPPGLYFLFKHKEFNPIVLILMIVVSGITGVWAYFDAYDIRYYFHMYPFLLLLVLLGWKHLFSDIRFLR